MKEPEFKISTVIGLKKFIMSNTERYFSIYRNQRNEVVVLKVTEDHKIEEMSLEIIHLYTLRESRLKEVIEWLNKP